ncbi:MAG: GNAT family N-acetyltransferase [Rhizobiales bacterium]|nr:GNAT family N-acetyltransferase [Hyphomicrobiales bacterium]
MVHTMRALAHDRHADLRLRCGLPADIAILLDLEGKAFTTDQLSRKSFRHFLDGPNAYLLVAELDGVLAGYVLVIFRPNSIMARLYSIAVFPEFTRRGIGQALLAAAEAHAQERGCHVMRLEVEINNASAIRIYEKSGYCRRGHAASYYDNGSDACRYEKSLVQAGSRTR